MDGATPRHCCPFARTTTLADAGSASDFEAVDLKRSTSAAFPDAFESVALPPPFDGATLIDSASTSAESAAAATGVSVTVTTPTAIEIPAIKASIGFKRRMAAPSRWLANTAGSLRSQH
jgi:hypothetical protein